MITNRNTVRSVAYRVMMKRLTGIFIRRYMISYKGRRKPKKVLKQRQFRMSKCRKRQQAEKINGYKEGTNTRRTNMDIF